MTGFLYRVQILEYPEGALIRDPYVPDAMYENPHWRPEGWAPDEEWIERYGRHTGSDFYWPSTRKEWRSRSSAMKRKQLIESYGAKAIIQRSARIVWPEDGQEHVKTS
jgi:hypothetical protein